MITICKRHTHSGGLYCTAFAIVVPQHRSTYHFNPINIIMSFEKKVTYEDLEELLKDDNKVKVGGEPV